MQLGLLILHKIMKGIEVRIPSVKFSIFESMERKEALSMQILFSA
jgi:hypothetical protein